MSPSRPIALSLLAAALCGAPTASAIVINSFRAPQEPLRPTDSAAYGFVVTVEATTGAGDGAGGTVPLIYRSWLGSWSAGTTDLVHAVDVVVPPGLAAGTKLRANLIMWVGCHPLPETFGIVTGGQGTGMDPMIGEFRFPTLGKAFGALGGPGGRGKNRCECLEMSNDPNLPPPLPQNLDPNELYPYDSPSPSPWPGYPGGIVPEQILLERVPCDGDADGNFIVDQDDLDLVLFGFGSFVPPGSLGDVDGDGDVDQDDLDLILFNFGCQN